MTTLYSIRFTAEEKNQLEKLKELYGKKRISHVIKLLIEKEFIK